MQTEYEATFYPINKDQLRQKLKKLGAKCIKSEFLMKRQVFHPPANTSKGWVRLRDEGDKITLAFKVVEWRKRPQGKAKITDQKEIEIEVSDFNKTYELLEAIGCTQKSYQENKREIWDLNGVEICLDTWPGLKPIIEIESDSKEKTKQAAELLGFDWQDAVFDSIAYFYCQELNIARGTMLDYPIITFENPLKKLKNKKLAVIWILGFSLL